MPFRSPLNPTGQVLTQTPVYIHKIMYMEIGVVLIQNFIVVITFLTFPVNPYIIEFIFKVV